MTAFGDTAIHRIAPGELQIFHVEQPADMSVVG